MNVENLLNDFIDFIREGVLNKTYLPLKRKTVFFGDDYTFEFKDGFLKDSPSSISFIHCDEFTEQNFVDAINDFVKVIKCEKSVIFVNENNSLFRDFAKEIFADDEEGVEIKRDRLIRKGNGGKLFCHSRTGILGVGLDVERFEILFDETKIKLSRSTFNDLQDYYLSTSFVTTTNFPAFNVEIEKLIGPDDVNIQHETEIFHWILALIGVGSASSFSTDYYSDDSSVFNRSSTGRLSRDIRFGYNLKIEKLEILKKLYPDLRSALIRAGFLRGELNALQVAFERYRDGLHYDSFQKQVSSAVMGLEAIFTEKGTELKYRLKMRVGYLFKNLHNHDYSPLIKLAYEIRSDYAHGNVNIEKYEKMVINQYKEYGTFSRHLLNLLRVSIMVNLLLDLDSQVGRVKTFQESMDSSMLLRNTEIIEKVKELFIPLGVVLS